MNKVILAGHLSQDPELSYTESGTAVVNANIATTERYTDNDGNRQEQTEFHRLVIWGRAGEVIHEYLEQGDFLMVDEGRLQTREWEDQDGNTQYTTEVKVISFEFGPRANNDQSSDNTPQEQSRGAETAEAAGETEDEEEEFEPDDDLPF